MNNIDIQLNTLQTKTFSNANVSKIGTKLSEETKRKISNSLMGHKGAKMSDAHKKRMSEYSKNRVHTLEERKKQSLLMMGHKISESTRQKLRDSHKGLLVGSKSPTWKGGITPVNLKIRNSIEIKLWRKACFERDNFTCQKCMDSKGGNLRVHHINNFADFPELRTSIENGITLCCLCHNEFHKTFGRKNNTYKQLQEFLIKLL